MNDKDQPLLPLANIYQENGNWRIHHLDEDFHWEFLTETNALIVQDNHVDSIFARGLGKALVKYLRIRMNQQK